MPTSASPPSRRPPFLQYALLCLLLLIAGGYQGLLSRDILHTIFHPESAYPNFLVNPATGEIAPAGAPLDPGLKAGDVLLAIDGVPYTGTDIYDEVFARANPEGRLTVTVREGNAGATGREKTVSIPLRTLQSAGQNTPGLITTRLVLFIIMPSFGLALGFWVAAIRPRDPLAWLLLGVMLGFSQLLGTATGQWGPGIRDVARAYHLLAGNSWSICMLLFGLYFPEPFALEKQRWWRLLKWNLVALIFATALPDIVVKTVDVENYRAVESLSRYSARLDSINAWLTFFGVAVFFAALFIKGTLAVSRDAKRRLRLLYFGSAVALLPTLLAAVVGLFKGTTNLGLFLPQWLLFSLLLLLFLFPLTLAYTIVVQRALDVQVVIRQGLQYALARSGVRFVGMMLSVAVGWAAVYLIRHADERSPAFYLIIAAALLAGFGFRRFGDWLLAFTDRRFFRDAYNAEQILSDLGEQVRSIVDTRSLLEVVSLRISESLHVPRVATLLNGNGSFCPAFALGYPEVPAVSFAQDSVTVRQLVQGNEPARVYLDDPNSWLYRRPDVRADELSQLQQLGTELLLPIARRDQLLGFVSLSGKRSEAPYSSGDLRLLKSVSVQTGLALENARLTATVAQEAAEREKLGRELEIAREVQQRLFPQKLPPVAGLSYSGACRPALGVGGDYYDFLALPNGRLGIALGDVSGKGIAAALLMASLQASLRAEAMRAPQDLARMIGSVNRLLFNTSNANRYATFFYAQYDPGDGTLTYVNAGHNPPMLLRKVAWGCEVLRLETGGTVVGLLESAPFAQETITLQSGDLLILYTDGVSEAMNQAEEEWGEESMIEAARNCGGMEVDQVIGHLMRSADAFASGAPQHDDMTLVVLRVEPVSEKAGLPVTGSPATDFGIRRTDG